MRQLLKVFVLVFAFLIVGVTAVSAETLTKTFDETDQRNFSTEIEIPNLYRITKVTASTGNVSYSVSGNKVILNFSNGAIDNTRYPKKEIVYNPGPVRSKTFPSTYNYNINGWHGTLTKIGEPKVEPQDWDTHSCSVSYGWSTTYPSGTRTCTANGKSVTATMNSVSSRDTSTVSYTDSKTVTTGPSYSNSGVCYVGNMYCALDPGPSSITYNSDGYSGTLSRYGYSYSSAGIYEDNQYVGFSWQRSWSGYTGTVTKTVYVQEYSTTFSGSWREYFDRWSQDYTGTITGPLTSFYVYGVEIEYSINNAPELEESSAVIPRLINSYSQNPPEFRFKIRDKDGDRVTATYILYTSNTEYLDVGKTYGTWYKYKPTTLPDGTYTLKVRLNDNKAPMVEYDLGTVVVDRTPPTLSYSISVPTHTSNYVGGGSAITVSITASEVLKETPVVYLNGKKATVAVTGNRTYRAYVLADESMNADKLTLSISGYEDLNGNVGLPIEIDYPYIVEAGEFNPNVSVRTSSNSPFVVPGNTVYVDVENARTLQGRIANKGISSTSGYIVNNMTAYASMGSYDPQGLVHYTIFAYDRAGNYKFIDESTDGSYAYLTHSLEAEVQPTFVPSPNPVATPNYQDTTENKTVKGFEYISIYSSGPDPTIANVNDTITLRFKTTEAYKTLPAVKLAGITANVRHIQGEEYEATVVSKGTSNTRVSISIPSGTSIIGNSIPSSNKTTDGSYVDMVKTAAAQKVKITSFKSLGTQGATEATWGVGLEARVLVPDISDIKRDKDKLRPLVITNGSHYRMLDFYEISGSEIVYRTVVDSTYTLNSTYTVHDVDVYDSYNRRLSTSISSGSVQMKQYGTPKFVSHEIYTDLGGTSGSVGQNFFVKINAEYDMLLDITRSGFLNFNGRSLQVHEITPAYVVFKGVLSSTDTEGYTFETSSSQFRDVYGRWFQMYKGEGTFKISSDPTYISSLFQTSNPDTNIVTDGDYVYLTLRTTQKAEPPATITIGDSSVSRKDLGDGYYLYTKRIDSSVPEGKLEISIPKEGVLPALTEKMFTPVQVKRSHDGWESVTLTSSKGMNVTKGDTVVLTAVATSEFLENPTVVVGGIELTTYVSGKTLRATLLVDVDTPYGQLDFKISNVKTRLGSSEVTTVTSGGVPNHSTNSNYISNVLIGHLNDNGEVVKNSGYFGGTSRVVIDIQGQVVEPGIINIYNEDGAVISTGPVSLEKEGTLIYDFKEMSHNSTRTKYLIELTGTVVNSGGKEVPVYYMGFGTGDYANISSSTGTMRPSSFSALVNGVPGSFVKVGDELTLSITFPYQIMELPQTVIVGERSENVVSTKVSEDKKTLIAVRKITSNIPDGLIELDLTGMKGVSPTSSDYIFNVLEPYGYITLQKYRTGYTVPTVNLPTGIKNATIHVTPEKSTSATKIVDGIPTISNGFQIVVTLEAQNTFASTGWVSIGNSYISGSLSDDKKTWTGTAKFETLGTLPGFAKITIGANTFRVSDASGNLVWVPSGEYTPKGVVPYMVTDDGVMHVYNTVDAEGNNAVRFDPPTGFAITGYDVELSANTKLLKTTKNGTSYYYAYTFKNQNEGNTNKIKAKSVTSTHANYPGKKLILYADRSYTKVVDETPSIPTNPTDVTIRSSDGSRPTIALDGDKIYLTTVSKTPVQPLDTVANNRAKIAGKEAQSEVLSDIRSIRSSITVDANTTRGLVAFSTQRYITSKGNGGYSVSPETTTTDGSFVVIMDKLNVLSNVSLTSNSTVNPLIQAGDKAQLKFTYEEYDPKNPTTYKVKIGNVTRTGTLAKNNTISVDVNDTNFKLGNVEFEITVNGSVGEITVTQTTDGSYLTYVKGNNLKSVSITSSNPNNKAIALNGNRVTVTLEYENDITTTPVIQLAGKNATVSYNGKVATGYITVGFSDPRGEVSIKVGSPVGNTTFPVTTVSTTDKSNVTILDSIPEVNVTAVKIWSSNADKKVARVDDTITLEVTYAENINTKPSALIHGSFSNVTTSGNKATATLKVTDAMNEGLVAFAVSLGTGVSGGNLKSAFETTDGSYVEIIKSIPIEIVSYSITSSNANPRLAKAGDTVIATVKFNQPLTFNSPTISGVAASVTNVSENTYQFRMQVPSTIKSEQAILNIVKIVGVGVESNNATLITTDGSSVKIDVNAPKVLKLTSSKQSVQRAETIKLNIEMSEEIQGLPAVSVGSAHGTVKKINTTLYEATVQIAVADKDGYLPIKVSGFYDMAGNSGVVYTNSNMIYLRTPTTDTVLESIKIRTSTGTSKVTDGNTVYIDIDASSNLGTNISAFVNGNVVNNITVNKDKATLEYIISSRDKVGMVDFVIYDLKDSEGKVIESLISSTTDFSYADVYRDNTAPIVVTIQSNNQFSSEYAKAGDVITVKVSSTKDLESAEVTDTMNSSYTLSKVSAKELVYTRTVSSTSTEGHVYPVVSSIKFKDGSAGDDITGAASGTTNNSSVIVDITPPTVRNYSITSNQLRIEFSETVRSFNLNRDSAWTQEAPMNSQFTKTFDLSSVARVEITDVMDRAGNVLPSALLYQAPAVGDSSIMITITGIQNGGVYSEFAVPVYTASSSQSDEVTVSATLNGSPFVSGRPVTTVGNYTLVVYAVDSLGNNDTLTYTFEIR